MENPWEFGWEAIGAIVAVLTFVVYVVVEWDRIKDSVAIPVLLWFVVFLAGGAVVGYCVSQVLLWWRLAALLLVGVSGAAFGTWYSNPDAAKELITILLLGEVIGVIIGLWVAA